MGTRLRDETGGINPNPGNPLEKEPYPVPQENYIKGLPEEMLHYPQWVGFNYKKVPLDKDFRPARVSDPNTWMNWQQLMGQIHWISSVWNTWFYGWGFVLTENDPYTVLDLDGVRNPKTGEIELWARELIEEFETLTEVSVSGTGLHVIFRAELPENFSGRFTYKDSYGTDHEIEIYDRKRYFALTCDFITACHASLEIEDRQKELDEFVLGPDSPCKKAAALGDGPSGLRKQFSVKLPAEEGARNDTMFRLACSAFRRLDLEPEGILEQLRELNNEENFHPPLEDKEVVQCFRSASRYSTTDNDRNYTKKTPEEFRDEVLQKKTRAPGGKTYRRYFYENLVERFGRPSKKPCAPCVYTRDGKTVKAKLLFCSNWCCHRCAPYRKELYAEFLIKQTRKEDHLYWSWVSDEEWEKLEGARRHFRRNGWHYIAVRTEYEDGYEVISTQPFCSKTLKIGHRKTNTDEDKQLLIAGVLLRIRRSLFKRERLVKATKEWSFNAALKESQREDEPDPKDPGDGDGSAPDMTSEFVGIGPPPVQAFKRLREAGFYVQLTDPDKLSGLDGEDGTALEQPDLYWGAEILLKTEFDLDRMILLLGIKKYEKKPDNQREAA